MMMANGLQDEDSILDWAKLDAQQHAAALKAHDLFVGMANHEDKAAPRNSELDSFLPRLDAHRRNNHTVLIDGTRGSGKTGVMLRLLQDWSDKLTIRPSETPLKFDLQNGALLVPVGLLDLEAVPQAANLATRIAGLFERVVAAMEARGRTKDPLRSAPAWAALEDDTLTSRQKWQHFVSAAALEWDRSLERRRTSIDPEAYAVEVEQAERKGLHARACFREFIDALVADWKDWPPQRGTRPFFIVPIDDADLNPARVVELFGLLRTLWHPRVGYLLTGDSGLFEHVLTTHFRSQTDMPHLGGPTTLGEFRVQLMPDKGRQAERLARDLYQKAVPLPYRLKLEPLSGAERLAIIKPALPRPLDEFLSVDDFSALALPSRWRQVIDLRDGLLQGEFAHHHGTERFALALWQHALNESPLTDYEINLLLKISYIDEHRSLLRLQPSNVLYVSPTSIVGSTYMNEVGSVAVRSSFAFEGTLGSNRDDRTRLSDAVVAVWLLMNNLTRSKDLPFRPYRLKPFDFWLVDASIRVENEDIGNLLGNREAGIGLTLQFRWPVPAWNRYLEEQSVYKRWQDSTPYSSATMDAVARVFVSAVLSVSSEEEVPDTSWEILAKCIVATVGDKKSSDEVKRWARERAGLLAAPESGLLASEANEWLDAVIKEAKDKSCLDLFRKSLKRDDANGRRTH